MPDDAELGSYGRSLRMALRLIGPTSRERVLAMLVLLGLTPQDAQAVLAHAVASGTLVVDEDMVHAAET